MNDKIVSQVILSLTKDDVVRYSDYWKGIAPRTDEDRFWRFVFAFLSVHTTWQANLTAFNFLKKNWSWIYSQDKLMNLLLASKAGMHTRRAKGIWDFSLQYWDNPNEWRKQDDENWVAYRDRLVPKCYGLGLAKTAFAIEMCYPDQCKVVCLDTHMIQLYGYAPSEVKKCNTGPRYKAVEANWIGHCDEQKIPSFIARNIFWDNKQKQTDSRYWTHVLEK